MTRRHPHPDRVAETYRRHPDDPARLVWVGYVSDPPAGARWSDEIGGWIWDDAGPVAVHGQSCE